MRRTYSRSPRLPSYPGGQDAERVHGERKSEALVTALRATERKQRALVGGYGVRGGLSVRPECDTCRDWRAKTGPELQVGSHERRRPHVDDKRIAVRRKTEGNRVGAERRPRTAER